MPAAPESLNTNFAAISDSIFIDIPEEKTDRLSVSSGGYPLIGSVGFRVTPDILAFKYEFDF